MLHASALVIRNSIRRRLPRSEIRLDSTELLSLAHAKNEKEKKEPAYLFFNYFSRRSSTNTQTAAEHNKICTFSVPANVWSIKRVYLINWMNKPLLFKKKRRNILFAIFFTHANRLSSDYFSWIWERQVPYCLYCKDKDFSPIALYFPSFYFGDKKFGQRALLLQKLFDRFKEKKKIFLPIFWANLKKKCKLSKGIGTRVFSISSYIYK
jgi:hypothetical protein